MKLTFLGGAGTVTGSKSLLETNYKKLLIDCGLFQGLKELRLKNWEELPINSSEIDAVFLTHAHLDHSGYLPILVKNGYKGKIYCSEATRDLAKIILLDSGKIQEEDAHRANEHHYTKHEKAVPLYDKEDAANTLPHFQTIELNKWFDLDNNIKFKFLNSGHILGSTFILFEINGKTFVFSGDVGRKHPILLNRYEYIENTDYLVIESTYGNRLHEQVNIKDTLLNHILKTYERGGTLIIPTFSVERAQEIIYLLSILKRENKLPKIPIYLDSPMGVNATEVYLNHKNNHILNDDDIQSMLTTVHLVSDVKTSKAIVRDKKQKIVLAGSGMITGGRVLHYLENLISDPKNTVLIVGYQAAGTRGRALISGDHEIKFFGKYHTVRAEVAEITGFSGHADQSELLDWLKHYKNPPTLTFINHGEPHQSQALKTKINNELGWKCTVAKIDKEYYLD
ncbi:MBL fold metallo-hydrolase [Lutibacter sp.]|uniref:MBL fold metallo-hydrolase RNA specificity domain-containing protein n=1 Tax=Lutibacter sp. TaxID=1925666 RepID=UPI0025C2EA53|nr:MBL fold metallo-hydrolase [Lutibacter sp.]MCF6182783.1 MBL fold metallo-hydrolase [Lutibacter sp.]